MSCIEARGLRKAFGATVALDGVDLRVEEGRILGLIGPNGAGKTTALHAILGLTPYHGDLKVLGRDPWTERDELMRDVCFIADVAVLRVENGNFGFVDMYGARQNGSQKLTCELTFKGGKLVYDLNGMTRPQWDTLPKDYRNTGDARWDGGYRPPFRPGAKKKN